MVVIKAIAHRDTFELAQYLNSQRSPPPRNFVPELVEGSQIKPCTGWPNLEKPPPNDWWADRQNCECPPCYYYNLTDQINSGLLPFTVAVPLAQLINVGLIRLNFKHADHKNEFTAEDKDYALSAHRDICYGINSDQMPLQLLEILLTASRKAVLKPLTAEDPEYNHKEFEMYLKRAIQRLKQREDEQDEDEQTQEGARPSEDGDETVVASSNEGDDETEAENDVKKGKQRKVESTS